MAEGDRTIDDGDQTVVLSMNGAENTEWLSWPAGDRDYGLADENYADDPRMALTSLGYLWAAVRRSGRLLAVFALLGLLCGGAVFKSKPLLPQATTSLLLANPPGATSATAIANDQAIVQSRTIAGQVEQQLGMSEPVGNFVKDYTTSVDGSNGLIISVKAATNDEALREANALAAALLSFQSRMLNSQAALVNAALQSQVKQDKQLLESLNQQIANIRPRRTSAADLARLNRLQSQRATASGALAALQSATDAAEAAQTVGNATAVHGSRVLDTASIVKQSVKKRILLYVGGGLVAGLAIGIAIVVARTLLSQRLRRRDDIARTLGAPVRLSVSKVKLRPWELRWRGLDAARGASVRRIIAHLKGTLGPNSGEPTRLAVIPVDDIRVPAICVASLAESCAQGGLRVVVADLCAGAPAAKLLGMRKTGMQMVSANGTSLYAVVPQREDLRMTGPLRRPGSQEADDADHELTLVCRSADVLITLADLDPGLGSEHLAGWTTNAVAMITAGRSSAAKIYAVGEMCRLSGPELISAVLIGADKTDESLGQLQPSGIDGDRLDHHGVDHSGVNPGGAAADSAASDKAASDKAASDSAASDSAASDKDVAVGTSRVPPDAS